MRRSCEQSCNGTCLVKQDVAVRFLHLGKLMVPRRSILFVIKMFVTVFKTAQHLPDLSIPDTKKLILEVKFSYFSREGLDSEAVRSI